jgi:hypothetical protein
MVFFPDSDVDIHGDPKRHLEMDQATMLEVHSTTNQARHQKTEYAFADLENIPLPAVLSPGVKDWRQPIG